MRLSICAVAFALLSKCLAGGPPPKEMLLGLGRDGKLKKPPGPVVDGKEKLKRPNTKYFHEPGGSAMLSHYDRRYFHGIASDEERTDTQSHMIRAYLTFFREKKLDTWIAHGTLLGWWWNGRRLPWDFDLDTQVTGRTLLRLGREFNHTRYKYTSPDSSVRREYLLDVNPWIHQRIRGDGMNVIDARWIDVRNGLYIDITGLSETQPDTHPGIWTCKNNHRYHMDELYPMRETVFEGMFAKVPYAYDKILTDEYREGALVNTEHNGHFWDPRQREWIKSPDRARQDQKAQAARDREAKKKVQERKRMEWEASWP
ncbi:hypothetical protein HBI56_015180 [Parastagonospora nodorum]|uniref:LicD/FKTN/FKRP nucleotidyltransferase domain-containing protein n=1 Tax=Phaeosphaeria nodorum (strain SN15 / ATCC MYA-4574 / FGSC 10173) TaxID=321614 RepID=A0A7U2F1F0_PHANO|nr:hypothetical protein HBH56_084830 [Parastagonospora nodorum]QRC96842.1 hypothetical protein JI435_017310 [Parastagonospora nodorum SN15]KAH3930075.1 hypothetical protein HBH54_117010 [Parastagonospora nodorum]KAH3977015.1 hypothetical protein HBH51_073950 [Parastagonospora nodorum]KAH3982509.1 hypothetical protein HBH52_080530 [Parastagonospora nodorum]